MRPDRSGRTTIEGADPDRCARTIDARNHAIARESAFDGSHAEKASAGTACSAKTVDERPRRAL
jgi:hypothetical protein